MPRGLGRGHPAATGAALVLVVAALGIGGAAVIRGLSSSSLPTALHHGRAPLPSNVRIAFVRGSGRMVTLPGEIHVHANPQIFTVEPDGTGLRRLTWGPAFSESPAWSPDGSRLVFVRTPICTAGYCPTPFRSPMPSTLFTVSADGTGLHARPARTRRR